MKDYLAINKKSWDARLEAHLSSEFYNVKGFLEGKSSLNQIELDLLGNITGKSILHLQCHFGQDSISLSRMGANVTGVDFSDSAITKAKEFAEKMNTDTRFLCCDIYELPLYLEEKFDIVFTSYGTISWLPDLEKWSHVIQHFLKPNGQFIFVEFHPAVWMYDNDLKEVTYHYNNVEPIVEMEEGTYADTKANIHQTSICWNHGIGEVVNSLIQAGLEIKNLEEFCYAPYPFVSNSEKFDEGKYRITHFGNKFPLVYSIDAQMKR